MRTKLLYTVPEACEQVGLSRSTFYELLRSGAIRSVKVGSARRIAHSDLMTFVDGLRGSPGASPPAA